MDKILNIANHLFFFLTSLFLLTFLYASLAEKEFRAALISGVTFFFNCGFWWFLISSPNLKWITGFNLAVLLLICLFGLISLIKFFPDNREKRDLSKARQYDERDNMFSRNNLQNSRELTDRYYADNPDLQSVDTAIRNKPELGSDKHKFFDYYASPCFEAAFEYMEETIPASRGIPAPEKKAIDPLVFSRTITQIAKFYGACDVGITPLKSHHLYSHRGRHAETWGEKVVSQHKTGVVITIPMNVDMLKKAPSNTVIQESARKYVEVGKISNILASYIRKFGYEANAHNDANYEVLCVPLAIDAGLGELGRMGLLVHKVFGPCVRLAVVTTELELPPTSITDHHIESFCDICKKCSDNCPTQSIIGGDEPTKNGFRHWSINQETCFSLWKEIGSDCGFCITVCPYTKPNTFIHKLVRFYISRNIINQHIALFFDDLFYGRKKKISGKNPQNIFLGKF